jgi:hypothetical protein
MTFRPSHALLFVVLLYSCSTSDRQRVCNPLDLTDSTSQCERGERCTVGARFTPLCAPVSKEGLAIGQTCEEPSECAEGLGCIFRFGLSRCTPFCALNLSQEEADKMCAEWPADTEDKEGSLSAEVIAHQRCLLSHRSHPDIGACVAPCVPWATSVAEGACQQSGDVMTSEDREVSSSTEAKVSCDFSLDLPFTLCRQAGDREEGAPCGVEARCQPGLSCAIDGGAQRCLPMLPDLSRCPNGSLLRLMSGYLDPLSNLRYGACWSDVEVLGLRSTSGETYRLSLLSRDGASLGEARQTPCPSGATLARPIGSVLRDRLSQRVTTLIAEYRVHHPPTSESELEEDAELEEDSYVWVDQATRIGAGEEESWMWSDGTALNDSVVTLDVSSNEEDTLCLALSLSTGALSMRPCVQHQFTLCAVPIPSLKLN